MADKQDESSPSKTLNVYDLINLGSLATWSVSSSKPGYGVENLSDPDMNKLWQSEGNQPHVINIQFNKRQSVSQISIYANVRQDDSYTPQKVSIRAGTYHGDLYEVLLVDMKQPEGWQHLKLKASPETNEPVRAHLIQVAILSNHMNGKDTHVRGMKIFATKKKEISDEDLMPFTSVQFLQHETIR